MLPVLERFNPRIVETLAAQAERFRDDDQALEDSLAAVLPATVRHTDDALQIDRTSFLGLSAGLQKRLLRKAVEGACGNGADLSAVQTGEALEFMRTTRSGRRLDLPCGLGLEREYGAFLLRPRKTTGMIDSALDLPGTTDVPVLGLSVQTSVGGAGAAAPDRGNYLWQAVFDYDKITLPLHLRNRRPGDTFHPAGMGGRSKKLQDYFVDSKIPRTQRDSVPLLTTERDILWVVGMRTDGRFLPGPDAKKVLVVRVRRSGWDVNVME
jgi:tRNA(Ile)-lysidine synthase